MKLNLCGNNVLSIYIDRSWMIIIWLNFTPSRVKDLIYRCLNCYKHWGSMHRWHSFMKSIPNWSPNPLCWGALVFTSLNLFLCVGWWDAPIGGYSRDIYFNSIYNPNPSGCARSVFLVPCKLQLHIYWLIYSLTWFWQRHNVMANTPYVVWYCCQITHCQFGWRVRVHLVPFVHSELN